MLHFVSCEETTSETPEAVKVSAFSVRVSSRWGRGCWLKRKIAKAPLDKVNKNRISVSVMMSFMCCTRWDGPDADEQTGGSSWKSVWMRTRSGAGGRNEINLLSKVYASRVLPARLKRCISLLQNVCIFLICKYKVKAHIQNLVSKLGYLCIINHRRQH